MGSELMERIAELEWRLVAAARPSGMSGVAPMLGAVARIAVYVFWPMVGLPTAA